MNRIPLNSLKQLIKTKKYSYNLINKQFKSFFSSSPSPSPPSSSTSSSSTSSVEKFKLLWKKYGYVFVGTYLSVYGITLTSIFFALEIDIFKASDFGYDAKTLTQSVN